MDISNINISAPVSVLGKGADGYYTSNDIFEKQENISSRYKLRARTAEEIHYLIFSLREGHDVCYLGLSLEKKDFDVRDSNHIELFDISLDTAPKYNDTAPLALEAICRKSRKFSTDEVDIVEALFYLSPYIPIRLKERIIFSFDDSSSDVVSLSREEDVYYNKANDYYTKYCLAPQLYYELFGKNIENLYLKGYYPEGPYICLKNAVMEIDRQIAEKEAEERRKREAEERQKKEAEELNRKIEEAKRQAEERKKCQLQNFQDIYSNSVIEKSNGEIYIVAPKDDDTKALPDVITQKKDNILPTKYYPSDRKFYKNPLYSCCLVNFLCNENPSYISQGAWEDSSFKQISDFADNIKDCGEMINFVEPSVNKPHYRLYEAVKSYLNDRKNEAGLFFAMRFWIDDTNNIRDFEINGLDCKNEMENFAQLFLYEKICENDGLLKKQSKTSNNTKIRGTIQRKIKLAEKKSKGW